MNELVSHVHITKEKLALFKEKDFRRALLVACMFLGISLVINYYAALYAAVRASNPVTDIILSNTRVYDVDSFFLWGPPIFWLIAFFISFPTPHKLPFILKSISLFVVIRSIFICLTHLAPFGPQTEISGHAIISSFYFGKDLFFSGHTGLPYLMALIYWDSPRMRYFCLLGAVFFAAVVLLGHYHYSIDVFAAFFITFSIYHIAELFFKKEKLLFDSNT